MANDYQGMTIPELQDTINSAPYGNVMRAAIAELTGRLIGTIDTAVENYADAQSAADSALAEAGPAAENAQTAADSANSIVTMMGDIVLTVGASQPAAIPGKTVIWFQQEV